MAKQRITQDYIAKQLNVSRNTVSKIFNNQPGISEKTKKMVLDKAAELHYQHNIMDFEVETDEPVKDIAFICPSDSFNGSFWPPILKSTEAVLSQNRINFRLVIARENDISNGVIPSSLTAPVPSGIIIVGFFKNDYYKKILDLGLPTVALDISPEIARHEKLCDVILMDDYSATYGLTESIIKSGHTKIAFAGDKESCWSFFRRYEGYKKAMYDNGLEIPDNVHFDEPCDDRYFKPDIFFEKLSVTDDKPTAFVCANDYIAHAVSELQFSPYNVYKSITLSGFDDCGDFNIPAASFSTVHINAKELGKTLGEEIIWRINNPKRKFRFIEIESNIVNK